MLFTVLGPVGVYVEGRRISLARGRERTALAVLLAAGGDVSADALVDALWGSAPPPSARKSLQRCISRLRGTLREASASAAVPAPPPGVQPPPLWGREEHVREPFGRRVNAVRARKQHTRVEQVADAEAFRDYFKERYGPIIAAYRNLADGPERTAALDRDLADLARRHDLGGGAMEWEYLLVTAQVAGRTLQDEN